MAKAKIKKNKKRQVGKKMKPKAKKAKHKKNLGQRIKVKVVAEPKSENIYGAVRESNNDNILTPMPVMTDLNNNLIENKEDMFQSDDSVSEIMPSQETDYVSLENNEPEKIMLTDLPVEENISWDENIEPIGSNEEESYQEPEPFENLSLRQKNIIMYVAITCVMVAIIGFWFIGLRASLSQSLKGININDEDFNKIKNDFNNLGQQVGDIKTQITNKASVIPEITNQLKQNIIEEQLKNDVANKMKEQLQNQNTNLNVNALNNVPK